MLLTQSAQIDRHIVGKVIGVVHSASNRWVFIGSDRSIGPQSSKRKLGIALIVPTRRMNGHELAVSTN